jgi:hypothetical protein
MMQWPKPFHAMDVQITNSMRLLKFYIPLALDAAANSEELNFVCVKILQKSEEKQRTSLWHLKLLTSSSYASWLCVLDCTLLPLITLLLPLLGLMRLEKDQLEWLHQIGHMVALLFVLPVGTLSTIANYAGHQQRWIVVVAIMGLLMVGMANSHSLPILGHVEFLHGFHHGLWHRIVNMSGCGFLLTSNYAAHRRAKLTNKSGCCMLHSVRQQDNWLGASTQV